MTKNLVITYCIDIGKGGATDGSHVDSKGARITTVEDRKRDIFYENLRVYLKT